MSLNFIPPTLGISLNIDEVLNPKEDNFLDDWDLLNNRVAKPVFTWENLFASDTPRRSVVLGEPGSGKSTLLEQVFRQAASMHKQAAFVPLSTSGDDLSKAIETAHVPSTDLAGHLDESCRYKTTAFDLEDPTSCIVCFDALDEVSEKAFPGVIKGIIRFCGDHPGVSVLISCRKHYLKHSHAHIRQLDGFTYITVHPFNTAQIEDFLKAQLGDKATPETIKAILQKTSTNVGNSILTTPRYLKVFTDLLLNTSLETILSMKRVDLFEKAIYYKLESLQQKGSLPVKPNEEMITKRVLEKLALVMEIYQRNQITKEDLVTFLDEASSNINLIFLNQIEINTFITRVLKNIGDKLEFDNTEFQEYLAAKELLRLGRKSQVLYDLIIEPDFRHIYRNWYDVLRYVVELDPQQVVPLIEHLNQRGKNAVADDFFRLIASVDPNMLSEDDRSIVFGGIFSYFQKSIFYLGHDQASNLALFFVPANFITLRSDFELSQNNQDIRRVQNITVLLYYLLEAEAFTDTEYQYWRARMEEQAADLSQKYLQSYSLRVLRQFKDITLFEKLNEAIIKSDEEVQEVFLFSCCEVAPASPYTLQKVISYLKQNSKHAENLLATLTGSDSFTAVFTEMQLDQGMLKNVAKDFSGYDFYSFNNVIQAWNDKLEASIKDLLRHLLTGDRHELYNAESFIKLMVTLLCRKQEAYIFEFIRQLPEAAFYASYEEFLARLLKLHQVETFMELLQTSRHRQFLAKNILQRVRYVDNPQREAIYAAGREYFPELYAAWDAAPYETDIVQQRLQAEYIRFREELGTEEGPYSPKVFETLSHNLPSLLPMLQEAELLLVKKRLLAVFERIEVSNYSVTVTDVTASQKSIHPSNMYFFSFGFYIRLALDLGLAQELAPYRSKIVRYLVIATADQIEVILQYLGYLTDEDIRLLVEFCTDRNDDLLISSPRGFLKMAEVVQRDELVPVLKALVIEPKLHSYEKEEALECLGRIFPEQEFLQEIFDTYVGGPNSNFASIANAYLINKFKNRAAIEWRFERAKSWKDKPGEHGIYISDWELEAFKPSYFACAYNTIDPVLIPYFQDLLAYSVELRRESKHLAYSSYIQKAVYLYFENLKALGSYLYLKNLKVFLATIKTDGRSTGFERLLRDLELQYIEHLGAPDNMADCVKRYNELKAKTYLPISSVLELRHVLEEVLDEDINNFILQEGFHRPIALLSGSSAGNPHFVNEDTIQKTLKVQIENGLLRRGFRNSDIIREAQLYDNKRLDLLVSYGFIGPVMLELKLLHNTEVTNAKERDAYKQKLHQYLKGSHAAYGFYVLFKVKEDAAADSAYDTLKEEYNELDTLTIKKIDCLFRLQ